MPHGSTIRIFIRSVTLLSACSLLLAGCMRNEDEEHQPESSGKLTLDDIKRQLDEPPRQIPAPEPTAMKMRERWKAYGKHDNANAAEKEKKQMAEIFDSQNQGSWRQK